MAQAGTVGKTSIACCYSFNLKTEAHVSFKYRQHILFAPVFFGEIEFLFVYRSPAFIFVNL